MPRFTSAPETANGYCTWVRRIVIPLYFSPTPNGCPLRQADFSAGGSPMLATAMQQWQIGICFGASSVELQYNGSLNESEARSYFAEGTDDVAFTTLPLTGTTFGRLVSTPQPANKTAKPTTPALANLITESPPIKKHDRAAI